MSKTCSKCKTIKPDNEFYHRWDKPYLLQSHCKKCIINKTNENNSKDISKKHERDRKYHYANREKRIEYARYYNNDKKQLRLEYYKNRYKNNLNFKILTNIRNRIRIDLKRNSKSEFTIKLIGCSINELKSYLEKQFKDRMCWNNYGEWQIDHILPCSKFDLSKELNQKICFNYKNLQPLWKIENREKSNKILSDKEVCYL